MSSSPKLPLPWLVAGVVVVAAAIGYSVGTLKHQGTASPTAGSEVSTVAPTNQEAVAPFIAEAVTVGGKTVITGTISSLTTQGFELQVTKPVVNTATHAVGSGTVYYNVKLTPQTKLTQYAFVGAIPPQGGEPEIKQTVTKLTAAALKEGEVATVTGSDKSSGANLVALDVRITSVVKQ